MQAPPTFLFLFEAFFFTGAVLAFAGWQWWSVNQEIKRDREKAAEQAAKEKADS